MLPYFIVLIIVLALASIRDRYKFISNINSFLIFVVLVLFAGLRHYSVGSDTPTYVNYYLLNKDSLSQVFSSESGMELGFRLLAYLSKQLSEEYYVYLSIMAIFGVGMQIYQIRKYSETFWLSIFIFITSGVYFFIYNGVRQAIAAAVFFFAIPYLYNRNFIKYVLVCLFASFFHKSILVAIPLYFILTRPFSYKILFFLVFLSIFIAFSFSSLGSVIGVVNEKYLVYTEMSASGGKNLVVFYVLNSALFLFFRKRINDMYRKKYDLYLLMYILGTCIFLSVVLSGIYIEITRLSFYFLISSIFIWPIILKSIGAKYKIGLTLLLLIAHLLFFVLYLTKIGNLTPYILNPLF